MTDDDPRKKLDEALANASASEVLIEGMIEELKHLEGAEAEAKLAELERRLEVIADSLGGGTGSEVETVEQANVDSMEVAAAQLEARAKSARHQNPGRPIEASRTTTSSYRGLGFGLMIAYAAVGPLIAGWFIGWLVDRGSQSTTWQTWGTIIGLVLGFVAAIFLLSRSGENK